MIREKLIDVIKEAKGKDEPLARELRSIVHRRFPDRETYNVLEAIFDTPQPMKQATGKEIVLKPEHFQKKTNGQVQTVVDNPVKDQPKKEEPKPVEIKEVEGTAEDFVGGFLEDNGPTDDEIVEKYGSLKKLRDFVNGVLAEMGEETLFKNTIKSKVCDTYRKIMA